MNKVDKLLSGLTIDELAYFASFEHSKEEGCYFSDLTMELEIHKQYNDLEMSNIAYNNVISLIAVLAASYILPASSDVFEWYEICEAITEDICMELEYYSYKYRVGLSIDIRREFKIELQDNLDFLRARNEHK